MSLYKLQRDVKYIIQYVFETDVEEMIVNSICCDGAAPFWQSDPHTGIINLTPFHLIEDNIKYCQNTDHISITHISHLYTRWFKYDRDWVISYRLFAHHSSNSQTGLSKF